jgi:hypothetical protein
MQLRSCLLSLLFVPVLGFAATPPAGPVAPEVAASTPSAPVAPVASKGRAATRGGSLTLRWNDDLLLTLGVERRGLDGRKARADRDVFALDGQSRFELDGNRRALSGLAGGEARASGGYVFVARGKRVRWTDPTLLVRPGEAARIDLRDADGRTLFYIDTLMHEFLGGGAAYDIRSADIRIAPDFAASIGRPDAADWPVGEAKARMPVEHWIGGDVPKAAGDPNWPGEQVAGQPAGTVYRADVFMQNITPQLMRCGTCTFAPDGSLTGCTATGTCTAASHIVYAPNSTLLNNVANGAFAVSINNNGRGGGCPSPPDPATCIGVSASTFTADVPWWEKFTSSPDDPDFTYPYSFNDVHPNLIWNLYRLDAVGADPAGRITQIGRSGVKHAFLTTNSGAGCDTSNGNHVLGRSCSDTYGTGNNDASQDLGPRSELVPAKGLWGRCGSIFDPECDQSENGGAASQFHQRMLVPTPRVTAAGGSFIFESWYIVRDDINIYNTMATRTVAFNPTTLAPIGAQNGPFLLGPAIDKWVPRGAGTATSRNVEVAAPEGRFQVAVKVHDLGGGSWQYEYVVMNHDFAREETTGVESNHTLRVLGNHGFKRFSVPRAAAATISQIVFDDGDGLAVNDWAGSDNGSAVEWSAPNDGASLDWGSMSRFSFVSNQAPQDIEVALEVTRVGSPSSYRALVPGPAVLILDGVFADGFESP